LKVSFRERENDGKRQLMCDISPVQATPDASRVTAIWQLTQLPSRMVAWLKTGVLF